MVAAVLSRRRVSEFDSLTRLERSVALRVDDREMDEYGTQLRGNDYSPPLVVRPLSNRANDERLHALEDSATNASRIRVNNRSGPCGTAFKPQPRVYPPDPSAQRVTNTATLASTDVRHDYVPNLADK